MQSTTELNIHDVADTLVLSLDFDGCTDTTLSRRKLIDFIIKHCILNPQYKTIVVLIGSLRQFIATDYYNSKIHYKQHDNRFVSCSLLLKEFINELNNELQFALGKEMAPKVKRSSMLTSDLFNDLNIGTTLKYMDDTLYKDISTKTSDISISIQDFYGANISDMSKLEFNEWYSALIDEYDEQRLEEFLKSWSSSTEELEYYKNWLDSWFQPSINVQKKNGSSVSLFKIEPNGSSHNGDSVIFDDSSKIMSLYIHYQYLMQKLIKPFDLLHFDDRQDLLDPIDSFYLENPDLLPRRTTYRSIDWNSDPDFSPSLTTARPIITGTGNLNPKYIDDVKEIANSFYPITCPNTIELAARLRAQCQIPVSTVKATTSSTQCTMFAPKSRRGPVSEEILRHLNNSKKTGPDSASLT
ncbi:MAG: hypothetical protein P1U74_08565 [Legionellaceae bacterium]|nr:hypothetical protein [Legionellaceae bacterium]